MSQKPKGLLNTTWNSSTCTDEKYHLLQQNFNWLLYLKKKSLATDHNKILERT